MNAAIPIAAVLAVRQFPFIFSETPLYVYLLLQTAL